MSDDRFQRGIDALSGTLQHMALHRAVIDRKPFPETEIAGWFKNEPSGPQFWTGPPTEGMQPLFYEPARDGQEPVAWRDKNSRMITSNPEMYRDDFQWRPLYLAR